VANLGSTTVHYEEYHHLEYRLISFTTLLTTFYARTNNTLTNVQIEVKQNQNKTEKNTK